MKNLIRNKAKPPAKQNLRVPLIMFMFFHHEKMRNYSLTQRRLTSLRNMY